MSDLRDPLLEGGGEAADRIAAIDWSHHPLGPISSWPRALRTALVMCLRSSAPMVVCWGRDLFQFYNDAYRPILGATKHPRAMGAPFDEVWPEIAGMLRPVYDAILAGGASVKAEGTPMFLDRNGFAEETYFDNAHSAIPDDEGRVGGVLTVVTETTAKVVGDRRLRMLHALAEATADATDVVIAARRAAAVLDACAADVPFSATYLAADDDLPELVATSGDVPAVTWPIDAVIRSGASITVRIPDRERAVARDGWLPAEVAVVLPLRAHDAERAVVVGALVLGRSPHLPADGAYAELFALIAGHLEAAVTRARAWNTALRRAREESSRAEARLTALFEQAPVAVSVVRGPDLVFELSNPRYEVMVGRGGLVGRRLAEAFPELPDDAPLFALLRDVRASRQPFSANEYRVALDRTGEGRLEDVYFLFTSQPIVEVDGSVDRILTVAVDVTEQVRLRQQLEVLSLEREEILRNEQRARESAESASRAKDEFLAMLGHELRNPLAPISTALRVLQQREGTRSRELVVIERQVEHLARLVDDLLDVSRITRGKLELRRTRVELADVVSKAIELASPLLEERRHRLAVDVPGSGLVVEADPTRLAQVIANLLTNAAKYTEPRGHVRVRATQLDAQATPQVAIEVSDDGVGIAPEMLPRVFDMFVQERQTLDRSRGGLGLGLTIVRTLVAAHGGTVAAESAGPGKGSTFRVTLPLVDRATPSTTLPVKPPSAPPSWAAGLRILVVDDNEDAAEMLGDWLAANGAEVVVAHDGPTALVRAATSPPDVALVDIGLPAMDGYEVARHVRGIVGARALLVAVAGYGQEEDRRRSASAGFDAHLVKPIDLDALVAIVASFTDRTRGSAPANAPPR